MPPQFEGLKGAQATSLTGKSGGITALANSLEICSIAIFYGFTMFLTLPFNTNFQKTFKANFQ